MTTNVLNTYPISNDFSNSLTINSVAASAGNAIFVFASGRNNSVKSNFTAPSWNGESFTVVKEFVSTDPASIEIFALKCASSGTFNIVLPSDQYTGCHGHAVVLSGAFGASFYDAPVSKFYSAGTYSLPAISIPNMVAGDVALNALLATGWNAAFDDVSTTTHTTNGTQLAVTETVQLGSRRMYTASNTGVGSVDASYTKSNAAQPLHTLVGLRVYEEAASIDSYPTIIRSGSTGNAYSTGLSSVTSISVGSLGAIDIDDTDGSGTHAMPGLVDETEHELYGTRTVTITGTEGAPTTTTDFLPPEGMNYVVLGDDINDTETGAVFEFDPPAAEFDQIAKPEELGIDESGNILGDTGVYVCWHLQFATKIARSYLIILGDPPGNTGYGIKSKRITTQKITTQKIGWSAF